MEILDREVNTETIHSIQYHIHIDDWKDYIDSIQEAAAGEINDKHIYHVQDHHQRDITPPKQFGRTSLNGFSFGYQSGRKESFSNDLIGGLHNPIEEIEHIPNFNNLLNQNMPESYREEDQQDIKADPDDMDQESDCEFDMELNRHIINGIENLPDRHHLPAMSMDSHQDMKYHPKETQSLILNDFRWDKKQVRTTDKHAWHQKQQRSEGKRTHTLLASMAT